MTEKDRLAAASHFAKPQIGQQAIQMALPMIEAMVRDPRVSGAGFLHIVVMTPGLDPTHCDFEDAILAEHTIGDPAQWDADYAAFAKAKAKVSWETGLDGCVVQATKPHLLKKGDSLLAGAICLDGITVGVSGAFPWYDEAIALTVAAQLRALCKAAHAELLQSHCTAACDLHSVDEPDRLYA